MRRFIAFVLAAVLLLAMMAMPAAAAETHGQIEIFHNQSDVATSTVVHGVNEAYVVTIPDRIDMVEKGVTETSISTSGVYLPRAKALAVNLSSANYSNGSWQLLLDTNNTFKMSYSIKNGGVEVTNGGQILYCAGGTASAVTLLSFESTGKPAQSGSYSDTLTFTVSVNEINN